MHQVLDYLLTNSKIMSVRVRRVLTRSVYRKERFLSRQEGEGG